MAEAVLTARK